MTNDLFMLSEMSRENLLKMAHVVYVIDDEYQIVLKSRLIFDKYTFSPYFEALYGNIKFKPNGKRMMNYVTRHGIRSLESRGVVTSIEKALDEIGNDRKLRLTIDVSRFKLLKKELYESLKSIIETPTLEEVLYDRERGISAKVSSDAGLLFEYDDEHGVVTCQNRTINLVSPGTVEGLLMYRTYRADGARIRFADIAADYEAKHPGFDRGVTLRTLTNAKDRINKKMRKEFGIEDVVYYQRQEFWLNGVYCSKVGRKK